MRSGRAAIILAGLKGIDDNWHLFIKMVIIDYRASAQASLLEMKIHKGISCCEPESDHRGVAESEIGKIAKRAG